MSAKRILIIIAAVCFALAWLLVTGTLTPEGEVFTAPAMGYLGLTLWATGHAL